jgi:hypothetical protein
MKNAKVDFAKIEALSGPPSVLRSEDRELYEKIRERFVACFAPEDVLEWHLVNRLGPESPPSGAPRTDLVVAQSGRGVE